MTFEKYLEDLDFDKLVRLWNEYCYSGNGSSDDVIYDSVEDIYSQMVMDGFDIARALFFGDVRGWNDRVYFNGYGNLYSVYNLESSPIDTSTLAEWLKDEYHEVYKEWKEDILGNFSEYLEANVDTAELYELWVEYEFEGEPASDDEVKDMFDIEILDADLIQDNHQLFQDWLEEQEDEEV